MPIPPAHRARADLCPGLLRPFRADDGAIIRLRLPGGEAPVAVLTRLLEIARHGAGFLQLTSRGNIQLRGLPDPVPDAVVDAVLATGLVPSPTHERARNMVASPLSGRWARNAAAGPEAVADVRGIVAELDRLICADPELAGLPGRFLFAVDDGRGDVVGEPFDVAYRAVDAASGDLLIARAATSPDEVRIAAAEAAGALVSVARAFQRQRITSQPIPWHVRELGHEQRAAMMGSAGFEPGRADERGQDAGPMTRGPRLEPGASGPHAVVGLPLGRLMPTGLDALAALTDTVLLTPWRSIVVPDAADRLPELAEAGFATSARSGWAKVSACTGAPGCARAAHSTESVARELVARIDAGTLALADPVHLVACERHCGATAAQRHVLITSDSGADTALLLR
ncbi:hypothetical protein [Granulicoccus sp. GXG6511]|uniref:hypothetical protein n=1 Tax=Granulicoccus sp. GXG6511 TaxID=3381351 RepID=UPI003D7E12FB